MASLEFKAFVEKLIDDSYVEAVKVITRKVVTKGGIYDWSKLKNSATKEIFVERFLDTFEKKKRKLQNYIKKEGFDGNDLLIKYSALVNLMDDVLNKELKILKNFIRGNLNSLKIKIVIKMEAIFP